MMMMIDADDDDDDDAMMAAMIDRGFAWTRVRQRHAENDVKHVRLNRNEKSTSEASQEQAKHIINVVQRATLWPQPQLPKTNDLLLDSIYTITAKVAKQP